MEEVNRKKRNRDERRQQDIEYAQKFYERLQQKAKASAESNGNTVKAKPAKKKKKNVGRSRKKNPSLSDGDGNTSDDMKLQERDEDEMMEETGGIGIDESEDETRLEKRRKTDNASQDEEVINIKQWAEEKNSAKLPPIREVQVDSITTGHVSAIHQQVDERKLPSVSNSLHVGLDPTTHLDTETQLTLSPTQVQPHAQDPPMGSTSLPPALPPAADTALVVYAEHERGSSTAIHGDIPRETDGLMATRENTNPLRMDPNDHSDLLLSSNLSPVVAETLQYTQESLKFAEPVRDFDGRKPPASNSLPVGLDPTTHHETGTQVSLIPTQFQPHAHNPPTGSASLAPDCRPAEYSALEVYTEHERRDIQRETDALMTTRETPNPLRMDPNDHRQLRLSSNLSPVVPETLQYTQDSLEYTEPVGDFDGRESRPTNNSLPVGHRSTTDHDAGTQGFRIPTQFQPHAQPLPPVEDSARIVPRKHGRRSPSALSRALAQQPDTFVVKRETPKPLRLTPCAEHSTSAVPVEPQVLQSVEDYFHFTEPIEDLDEVESPKSVCKRNLLLLLLVSLALSIVWTCCFPFFHSNSIGQLGPCFEDYFTDSDHGSDEGVPSHCLDVARLPCPGICKDGKLVSCGIHADVKLGTSCKLTPEAREIALSFNSLLRQFTVTCALKPTCRHEFFVGTEGDRPLFDFAKMVERLGLSGVDYSVLDASNQYEEELFLIKKLENGVAGIGVHPSLPLPRSWWTASKVWAKKLAKDTLLFVIHLVTRLISLWLSLFRKSPLWTSVCTGCLVFFDVYRRSRKLILQNEASIVKYRQRALSEIFKSQQHVTTADAVLNRIVWAEFPNRQHDRDRFAQTIWNHVVADLEKDTRVRVAKTRESGKDVTYWKWVDSCPP